MTALSALLPPHFHPLFRALLGLGQEASIIAGMRMLLDHAGLVVEPSAALGIAAMLEDRDRFAGRHVVTIVCGSNVDIDAYHRWVGTAPILLKVLCDEGAGITTSPQFRRSDSFATAG